MNKLLAFINRSLSELMSVYRSEYSANHVLFRLIKNCRYALDNNLFASRVLMNSSKAFNCISLDLVIVKLHANGLDFDRVTFLSNYLKDRKQSGKINNVSSFFGTILLGVPQDSILVPILFNSFLNNLSKWLKNLIYMILQMIIPSLLIVKIQMTFSIPLKKNQNHW